MREILLCVLLMFSVSLFAADGVGAPLGWYTVDVEKVTSAHAETPASVPERLSGSAVEQTNATQADGTQTTDTAKLIGEPSCCFIGAFAPIEVGWR